MLNAILDQVGYQVGQGTAWRVIVSGQPVRGGRASRLVIDWGKPRLKKHKTAAPALGHSSLFAICLAGSIRLFGSNNDFPPIDLYTDLLPDRKTGL